MPEQSPEAIVEAFVATWNHMDFEAMMALLHPNIFYHNMPMEPLSGHANVRTYLKSAWRFDSCEWEIINMASRDNIVLSERVDRFVINGKPIALPLMGTFEIQDHKIHVWRDYFDLASFQQQLALAAEGS